MGYFSNGTEGRCFEEAYCSHCVHQDREGLGCPVMQLHELWNYEQGECEPGTEGSPLQLTREAKIKTEALETFIPRDGIDNRACLMFHARTEPTAQQLVMQDLRLTILGEDAR